MTTVFDRWDGTAWQVITASVSGGTAVPDAPQNLTLSASDSAILASWQVPASSHGSPISSYQVTVAGAGTGTGVFSVAATQLSLFITNLTNNVSYTISVVAINGVGSSTPVSASSTPVSNVTLDPRTYDYVGLTGPQAALTTTYSNQLVTVTRLAGSGTRVPSLSQVLVDGGDNSAVQVFRDDPGNTIQDSELDCTVYSPSSAAPNGSVVARTKIAPSQYNMLTQGARTGAVENVMTMTDCEIVAKSDAEQEPTSATISSGGRALRQRNWYHPTYNSDGSLRVYYGQQTIVPNGSGGWQGSGQVMTQAQTDSVQGGTGVGGSIAAQGGAARYTPSKVVHTGDVFIAFVKANMTAYQVLDDGNGGAGRALENTAESALAWPNNAAFKIPSGGLGAGGIFFSPLGGTSANAVLLGTLGQESHQDGIQSISGAAGGRYDVKDCLIEHLSNSCAFIQSGHSTDPNPIWSIRYSNNVLRAGFNYWFYLTALGTEPFDQSRAGKYTRNASAVWSKRANQGDIQPWAVSFTNMWLGAKMGTVGPTGSIQPLTDFSNITDTRTKYFPLVVPDVATWQAKVANQYPGITQAQLDALWNGTADLTTLPAFDPTVLEARYQSGVPVGMCTAESFLVWSNVRRESDNALIYPTSIKRPGVSLDANGYYTGT